MRIVVLALMLLLAGCTTPIVQADVTRFHILGAEPGRSFTIIPEPDQVGNLEFQDYASLVANQLSVYGWRPVAPGGSADSLVRVRWGVGEPNIVTWQTPTTIYGGMGWGGHRSYYGGGFYDPFPYWETRSATYFPKWLSVEIADAAAEKAGKRNVLFQGRAVAEGTRREISPIIPYLVQALFTGFPGSTGRTVRVQVPVPK